jgi:molybdopterin-dependent oxidoreductase alpha subunit
MKSVFDIDEADLASGGAGVLDRDFISEHTIGLEALREDIDKTSWDSIIAVSGLTKAALKSAADVYLKAKNVILCYGMGITQHSNGTGNVQQLANLLMLRGNIGRPGAGICPLRGHSNVQGDRTVGITEIPNKALIDGMEKAFGFRPTDLKGHNAVESIEAMNDGTSKALICLGGNLAVAMSDPDITFPAMRKLDLAVHIATKLNRSHLLIAKTSIVLPCFGRTDLDTQATGPQSVTVEDSMSMVHASRGLNPPASEHLMSEPAIVSGIAHATFGEDRYDRLGWAWPTTTTHPRPDRRSFPISRAIIQGPRARRLPPGGRAVEPTCGRRPAARPTSCRSIPRAAIRARATRT